MRINKTAYFRLDGGENIGMGHAVRCTALATALTNYGWSCIFLCRPNQAVNELVTENGHLFEAIPALSLDAEAEFIDHRASDAGAIILDSYSLSDEYIHSLNHSCRILCCIDDNALYRYSCDFVINQNLFAEELDFKTGENVPTFLLGGKYLMLRDEFKNLKPKPVQKEVRNLFVCFGGSDINNFSTKVAEALASIKGVQVNVVIGPSAKVPDSKLIESATNVIFHKDPERISDLMLDADIAIISSGSITYECAVCGVPLIVSPQVDNQENLAKYLSEKDLADIIRTNDSTNTIRSCIFDLMKKCDKRKLRNLDLLKLIDSNGVATIAEFIDKAAVT